MANARPIERVPVRGEGADETLTAYQAAKIEADRAEAVWIGSGLPAAGFAFEDFRLKKEVQDRSLFRLVTLHGIGDRFYLKGHP